MNNEPLCYTLPNNARLTITRPPGATFWLGSLTLGDGLVLLARGVLKRLHAIDPIAYRLPRVLQED